MRRAGLLLALEAEHELDLALRPAAARVQGGQQRGDRRLVVGGGARPQPPLVVDRTQPGAGSGTVAPSGPTRVGSNGGVVQSAGVTGWPS